MSLLQWRLTMQVNNGSAEQEENLIAEQASHEPAGEEKEQSNSND